MLFMDDFDFFRKKRMYNLDGQTYVYKYIPLKYLISMLKNKKLRIDKITTWEDPYENFFLKEEFYTSNHIYKTIPIGTSEVSERIYGQSWTLKEESDAMWRIYSNINQGICNIAVKLKIKVDDLFSLVYTDNSCMATTSIGSVEYKSKGEFNASRNGLAKDASITDITNLIQSCLYIKRDSFSHEEEVRIIVSNDTGTKKLDFLEYDMPNLNVFTELVLDPRVTEEQEKNILEILKKAGMSKEVVRKSDLYVFTPLKVRI